MRRRSGRIVRGVAQVLPDPKVQTTLRSAASQSRVAHISPLARVRHPALHHLSIQFLLKALTTVDHAGGIRAHLDLASPDSGHVFQVSPGLDDGATSSIRLLVVSGSPPETVVQPPSRSMMAANPPVPGFSEQSPAVLMTVFAATVCYFWRLCALCLRWSVSPLGGLGRASRPAHALGLENPAAAACPPPPCSRPMSATSDRPPERRL